MNLVLYSLFMWFWFFVFNHAILLMPLTQAFKERLPGYLAYSLECPFCFTWWAGVALWSLGLLPDAWVFTAPVINLFLSLVYDRLSE